MKIVFMGTPDIAKESLEALYNAQYEIIGVVTNVDKPKGRGMKMQMSPVKEFALEKDLKIYQPEKVKNNEEFLQEMERLSPDIICVVAYGKILPQRLLDIPKLGCINLHGSLLPKYRGSAPIQWAVLNGDKTTGMTTMYMDAGIDTGDMILKQEVEIGEDETTGEVWNKLSKIGSKLLVETIKQVEQGVAPRIKQGDDFCMAPMLNREMGKIDWEKKDATEIKNLIRGLNPIMGAYTFLNEKKVKFWKANVISKEDLISLYPELEEYAFKLKEIEPGTILFADDKNGLFVQANGGILEVLEIQAENSKKMEVKDYLRGNSMMFGDIFE